ncbi:MAG: hypothetical protein NXI12_15295 [Alphaproteobacteria bacterium]|nr:hypothetical protein [Alphaproteobacteria bacterium]
MQSLDYKLKTSNTSYVTARHDVQYFPSSLSSFSPTTSRVCRTPLTSGTSFINPESLKIAFRVVNTDGTNPLAPATSNPACFIQRVQVFANGQRCDDINYYGRTVAVHDLLKGREYNANKSLEGFDEIPNAGGSLVPKAIHQGEYIDVLLRPTMVGLLRCGKMLPPQLNLVLEIEFADAETALWSANATAHPASGTLSATFEIQNVRVLASQVVLDSALVESFNRVLLSGRSLVFSYPTVHTQQSSVPAGVAEHNVTVARAFTKLMGTFWDDDAGSRVSLLMNPGTDYAHIGAARVEDSLLESQMQLGSLQYPHNSMKGASEHFHFLSVLAGTYDDTVRNIDISRNAYLRLRGSFVAGFPTERVPKMPLSGVSTRSGDLARFSFKGLDGTATAIFIHLVAYQLVTLSGTGVSVLD